MAQHSGQTWRQTSSWPGHSDTVFGLATTADERMIATSSRDGSVRIWDRRTGKGLTPWSLGDGWVLQVFFLNAGTHVAAAGWSKCMIRSMDSAAVSTVLEGDRINISASPRGTVLAIGTERGDVTLANPLYLDVIGTLELFDRPTNTLTVSDDDSAVIAAGSGAVVRINVATRKPEWRVGGHEPQILISHILIHPARSLVISCSYDSTVRVWDLATGRALAVLPHDGGVVGGAISPDGRSLFTHGTSLVIWDTDSWIIRKVLPGGFGISRSHFSPDGELLIAACSDGAVRIWDSQRGEMVDTLKISSKSLNNLLLCENGKEIIVCGEEPTCHAWTRIS